ESIDSVSPLALQAIRDGEPRPDPPAQWEATVLALPSGCVGVLIAPERAAFAGRAGAPLPRFLAAVPPAAARALEYDELVRARRLGGLLEQAALALESTDDEVNVARSALEALRAGLDAAACVLARDGQSYFGDALPAAPHVEFEVGGGRRLYVAQAAVTSDVREWVDRMVTVARAGFERCDRVLEWRAQVDLAQETID